MMGSITWFVVAIGITAALVLGLAVYGKAHWADATRALLARLEATRLPPTVTHYDARELEGLPAPVQRYFRAVLADGQPIITTVAVEHTGTFNVSQNGEQWKAFTSQQRVVTRSPGFVWNARMDVVPGMAVRVHDAYVGGEGTLYVAALGLFAMAEFHGTGDIAAGELMRFFAEATWYPTALLPSQGVRWHVVDDHAACATLKDGDITLTLLFHFGEDGLIDTVGAGARGRTVGGSSVPTPWHCRSWNYAIRDGMRVPLDGEAAWVLPEGAAPYFRGRVTQLSYEFAR